MHENLFCLLSKAKAKEASSFISLESVTVEGQIACFSFKGKCRVTGGLTF
ncbi:hypothetical protein KTAU_44670 [Thermogemmatispora aurantia]|uniref:Uncharacterized protein n=1 Tax=Thermogemmatispora aurantia TaxID=2045279 RepID=A0A5J4KED8_9CHLR|nr:hypothetical protein KTAU_44670 [Thermogemmatispora aurantia]